MDLPDAVPARAGRHDRRARVRPRRGRRGRRRRGWPASVWGSGDVTAPLPAETSAAERRIAVAVAGDAGDAVGPGGLGGLGDPGGPDGPAAHPGDGMPPTVPCDCPDCREVGEEIADAFRGRFDAAAFTDATLREAAALGLVAHGALTALGGGVAVRHSAAVLLAAAEELLPPAVRSARFRTDLTAVVAPDPPPSNSPACSAAAPTPKRTARRACGGSPKGPSAATSTPAAPRPDSSPTSPGVAVGGIPQRLHRLVHDVGRRYGQVRAAPAAAVVYSDDEALVAEIQRHSRLTALALRRIAPTVLLSGQPLDRTVAALRRAGYAPAAETATGSALVERAEEFRVPGTDRAAGWPVALPMPEELSDGWRVWAADVLGRAAAPAPVLGAKAARLREAAPLLGPEDCAVLADALDRGSAVRVAATAYNGEPMTSTVAHLAMAGDSLYMRPPNGRPALLPFRLATLWMVLPADD
ncbi:helicase-associated domain-containing protein [Yinghuangia aomiensis]